MTETATPATAPAPITEIPPFKNADGSFRKLKPRDFPRTREGRQAYWEFRAQFFESIAADCRQKATDITKQDDPAYNRERRINKLRDMLAKLEAETADSNA